MLCEPGNEIASDDLRMIEVELDADIRPLYLGDEVGGVLGAGEKVVRTISRIDGLEQDRDVLLGGCIGGACEIFDQRFLGRRPQFGSDFAGKTMDLAAADHGNVIERLL